MNNLGFLARAALIASLGWSIANFAVRSAYGADLAIDRIAWGKEIADQSNVGHFSHHWLTPDPNKVEVLLFFPYTEAWLRMEHAANAWADSLPDGVAVERVPIPSEKNHVPASAYFVGKVLGIENRVHDAIVMRIGKRGAGSLDEAAEADQLLTALGVEAGAFAKMSGNPLPSPF